MNEKELVELMIEIIISKQPLACTTSQIRRDLCSKYNQCYPDNIKIMRCLRQEAERNPVLVELKGGRDAYWRVTEGGVLNY